jgi:membrane protease YdiL (CAAX protease family)
MNSLKELRVFLGSFILLIVSYIIYFVRYPMWNLFSVVEPIFIFSFLSYFIVFIIALILLKKDSRKSLLRVFKNKGSFMILMGVFFAIFYLVVWYLISISLGSKIEFNSLLTLRGFESYAVVSLPLAFGLYLAFALFGAFAEEVAYRGYIQTRISSTYGPVLGIFVFTLFFSLQHIHIFEMSWIVQFFQTQFFHVFLFGIFGGCLFLKSKENIWSVFAMHAFSNAYIVSVPIVVIHIFPFTFYIAEITSFAAMIFLLKYLHDKNKKQ